MFNCVVSMNHLVIFQFSIIIPKYPQILLYVCFYHNIHLYLCNFKCLFYFLPFEGYFNYICVFNSVYWSFIDSFHIYYLPILFIRKKKHVWSLFLQGLVPPTKILLNLHAWFLRLEEIQFNRAKKPNAKDTKYGSTRDDWWTPVDGRDPAPVDK